MSNIINLKGAREAPKAARSSMETMIVSLDEVNQWRVPPFQRPVRVNIKVQTIAEEMSRNGVELTGIITLGKIGKDGALYIVDGQHRIEAFRISGLAEIIADVRICFFDTMGEMADEFVRLNSALVKMRPDDILRGLEPSTPILKQIREACKFIGYDNIRRNNSTSPIVSMSAALRCWNASIGETPAASGGLSAAGLSQTIDQKSAQELIVFLRAAEEAWGRDPEYYRLWGNLNLTVCMWLWRRLVLDTDRKTKRIVVLTPRQFKQCLMALSAETRYVDWLQGRSLGDRDRSPCYMRLKQIFVNRLAQESNAKSKPMMPAPAWASK